MKFKKIILIILAIVLIVALTTFIVMKFFVKNELECNAQKVYEGDSNSEGSCDNICKNAGIRYFNTKKMFCTGAKNVVEENGVVIDIFEHACSDSTINFPKTCNCCVYK